MSERTSTRRVHITLPDFFDLDLIMRSEQSPALEAFWRPEAKGSFTRTLVVSNCAYRATISLKGNELRVVLAAEDGQVFPEAHIEALKELISYQFDLKTDYVAIVKSLAEFPQIQRIFTQFSGLRTMRNLDFFEGAVASILSQNTSIRQLNKMLLLFSERFGRKLVFADGCTEFLFPVLSDCTDLTEQELAGCGFGYRARYISEFCFRESRREPCQYGGCTTGSQSRAIELGEIRGVGPKVEAMILSFALAQTNVFVVDVWVKRGLKKLLGWEGSTLELRKKAEAAFGENSTHVNTYIYYALRNNLLDLQEAGDG